MVSQYIISDEAIQDLEDISDYFLRTNVAAGEQLLKAFTQRCKQLVSFPKLGRSYAHILPSLRGLPLKGFIILYDVQETPDSLTIEILRVVHGKRDLQDIFRN
jgi:toxin ParE1/3/4